MMNSMAAIDLKRYLEHTKGRSLVEILLRGHLWLENAVVGLIEAEVQNAEVLSLGRMSFVNKLNLAEALGVLSSEDARSIRTINRIRNRLAHELDGEPTVQELVAIEESMTESQLSLASKLSRVRDEGESIRDSDVLVRLSMSILALLAEIEQHRQRHAYWKKYRTQIDSFKVMVAIQRRLGQREWSWDEYRKRFSIPVEPSPKDVIVRSD